MEDYCCHWPSSFHSLRYPWHDFHMSIFITWEDMVDEKADGLYYKIGFPADQVVHVQPAENDIHRCLACDEACSDHSRYVENLINSINVQHFLGWYVFANSIVRDTVTVQSNSTVTALPGPARRGHRSSLCTVSLTIH